MFWHACIVSNNNHAISTYNCTNDQFYGLTKSEFDSGRHKYKTDRWDLINSSGKLRPNTQDALSCWYSLDTLKKFICLIERYSADLKISSDHLGIRFHYAVYPDEGPLRNGRHYEPYAKLHTLFMTPTYKLNEKDIPSDFDPRYTDFPNTVRPPRDTVPILKYFSFSQLSPAAKPLMLGSPYKILYSSTANGMEQNQGQLCPPTCPLDISVDQ